jgi:hypothetical protein
MIFPEFRPAPTGRDRAPAKRADACTHAMIVAPTKSALESRAPGSGSTAPVVWSLIELASVDVFHTKQTQEPALQPAQIGREDHGLAPPRS